MGHGVPALRAGREEQNPPRAVGPIPACSPWAKGNGGSAHPGAVESIPEMGNGSVSPWKRGHWLDMPRGHVC